MGVFLFMLLFGVCFGFVFVVEMLAVYSPLERGWGVLYFGLSVLWFVFCDNDVGCFVGCLSCRGTRYPCGENLP